MYAPAAKIEIPNSDDDNNQTPLESVQEILARADDYVSRTTKNQQIRTCVEYMPDATRNRFGKSTIMRILNMKHCQDIICSNYRQTQYRKVKVC